MSKKIRITMKRQTRDRVITAMQILSNISDVAFVLRSLRNKPTRADMIAAGIKTSGILMNYISFEEEQSHFDKFWNEYYSERTPLFNLNEFNCEKMIINLIEDYFKHEIVYESEPVVSEEDKSVTSGMSLHSGDVDGVEVFWVEKAGEVSQGPFVEDDKEDFVMETLGKKLWETIGTNNVAFRESETGSGYEVVHDRLASDTLPSEISNKSAARIEKFLKHGYVRSIFFYGRAGTGKSTCMREIAKLLGMRSLRIDGSQIDTYDQLEPLITMLRPDCILIDDADRYLGERDLTTMEELRKNTKVIMASANHPSMMNDALLRPGRFDEAIHIDRLDDAVIKQMVGNDVPENFREILSKMPIAYLNEFNIRRKVLGIDGALVNISELVERCERMEIPNLKKLKEGLSEEIKDLLTLKRDKSEEADA